MRDYNSKTDYHIVRDAVAQIGLYGGFITGTKRALEDAGIRWPGLNDLMDNELTRAVEEHRLTKHYPTGNDNNV